MLRIEHRKMFSTNGLIDDFVLYGSSSDYVAFASRVQAASVGSAREKLTTASHICIEIANVAEQHQLFTSLQNQDDFYPSVDEWEKRSILRVLGSTEVLENLNRFLLDLSGRGEGYSYISEYSGDGAYSTNSPEWRLHVQNS